MVAKCGERRTWHWAHQSTGNCDHWWEPETEWHRNWKNQFSEDWQEISHTSADGETHIADVKTPGGLAIEIQHSHLDPNERTTRENFYGNMVWVVDGTRRIKDKSQFFENRPMLIGPFLNRNIHSLAFQEGSLLRDWKDSRVPVYFDFGDSDPTLWRLNPSNRHGTANVFPVTKAEFIHGHREGHISESGLTEAIDRIVSEFEKLQASQPRPLMGFERYMARKARRRTRF
jgi:hypothetical protein